MYTHIKTFNFRLFSKIINIFDRQQDLIQNQFLCDPEMRILFHIFG